MRRGLIVLGAGVWVFTIAISSIPSDRGDDTLGKIKMLAILTLLGGILVYAGTFGGRYA